MIDRFLFLFGLIAVLGCSTTLPYQDPVEPGSVSEVVTEWSERDSLPVVEPQLSGYANVRNYLDTERPMLALYREDVTHDAVVEFFVDLTGSRETALPILYHADAADISLSLVFALAWVESRYYPLAVNQNATSVDRGLFQLNSLTFRNLSEEDFFNPDVNSYHGTQFLKWCLSVNESEDDAIATYNAGLSRVRAGRTPQMTLVYVGRIKRFRVQLEQRFRDYILNEFPSSAA